MEAQSGPRELPWLWLQQDVNRVYQARPNPLRCVPFRCPLLGFVFFKERTHPGHSLQCNLGPPVGQKKGTNSFP